MLSDAAGHGQRRRLLVKRTFGAMIRCRDLVRDHEHRRNVSRAMILIATGEKLLRRNAHP